MVKELLLFLLGLIALLAIPCTLFYIIPDARAKKTVKNGKKTKVYIFDVEPWDDYGCNMEPRGAMKIYVDGKIKRIAHMEITDDYIKLYNRINEMYEEKEKINIKCIPIDAYIYNDKLTIDLESAEV